MQIWEDQAWFLSLQVLISHFYTPGVMSVSSQEITLEGNTVAYYIVFGNMALIFGTGMACSHLDRTGSQMYFQRPP